MLRGPRRPLFWLLLVAGVALFAWWLLYVPFMPQRLMSGIPAEATVVSRHQNVPDRWTTYVRNPFVLSLLGASGADSEQVRRLADSRELDLLIRELAPREVVWGYLPPDTFRSDPVWVFASWLGGKSQLMRWLLTMDAIPQMQAHTLPSGRTFWRLTTDLVGPPFHVWIVLEEGMLLGCVASRPDRIRLVLDAFEGRRESMASVRESEAARKCVNPGSHDHGWVNLPAMVPDSPWTLGVLGYELTRVDEEALAGRFCVPEALLEPVAVGERLDAPKLAHILGDTPLAFGATDTVAAGALLAALHPASFRAAVELFREQPVGAVVAAVLGDDLRGRYLGIRVPTLLVGIQVGEPTGSALRNVARVLDKLNARYRWGLIPRRVPVGRQMVYAVESATSDRLFNLELSDKPGYAVCGPWLFVASNVEALKKIVAAYFQPDAGTGPHRTEWSTALVESEAPVYAWLDLARTASTLRTAIRLYSFKLLVTEPQASSTLRQQLAVVTTSLEALEPLRTGQLWMNAEGGQTELNYRFGAAREGARP